MKLRLVALVGVAVLAATTLSGCGLFNSWVDKGVEIVGPENVQEQFDTIITDWEALTVTADNACIVGSGKAQDDDSPTLVESPVLAYAATYRNVRAEYNAAWDDIFKAGVVGPPGYPREIPNYPEAIGAEPDFCAVSAQLAALKEAS